MRTETVIIVPNAPRDEYDDPTGPSGTPRFVQAVVTPRRTSDPERGDVLISGFTLWCKGMLATTVPDPEDAILVRSEEYQVEGEPGYFLGKGVLVTVERAGVSRGPVT